MGVQEFSVLEYSCLSNGFYDTRKRLGRLPSRRGVWNEHFKMAVQHCHRAPGMHLHAKAKVSTIETPTEEAKCEEIIWPSMDDEVPFWKQDFSSKLNEFNRTYAKYSQRLVEQDTEKLYIVHVTAEMAPLAKVGGLADVVTGLARACLNMGHHVQVMLPFYECIPREQVSELTGAEEFSSFHRGEWSILKLYRGKVVGIPVLLLQPNNHFFKGSRIYGGSYDELEAYLFFTRACLEWMQVVTSVTISPQYGLLCGTENILLLAKFVAANGRLADI